MAPFFCASELSAKVFCEKYEIFEAKTVDTLHASELSAKLFCEKNEIFEAKTVDTLNASE